MDPAEVMLSGFIGVALLYCTSGFSLYNFTISAIFYLHTNKLHPAKFYPVLTMAFPSIAVSASACFFTFKIIRSLKSLAIGGVLYA